MSGSILIPHLSQEHSFDSFLLDYQKSNDAYLRKVAEIIAFWKSNNTEYQITTSGSTGDPKSTVLTKAQLQKSTERTLKYFELTSESKFVLTLNPKFIGGMMMVTRAIIAKAELIILPLEGNPLKFATSSIEGNFIALSPYQVNKILNSDFQFNPMPDLTNIIIGGASISSELNDKILKLKIPCYHTYGMTETCSHIALKRLNGDNKDQYFKVFENVNINITKKECLEIEIDGVKLTTNDRVEIINEREFKWLGRSDLMINSGGIKVQPENVEIAIHEFNQKTKLRLTFLIVGIEDEKLGEKVVMAIEGESWNRKEIDSYLSNLKKALPEYHTPKNLFFMEQCPITGSGKPDRREIKNMIYNRVLLKLK